MQTANFAQYEYLNAATLNAAAGAVSGSFAQTASGALRPGLIHPESVGITTSGLIATVQAPLPFQVLFGSGVLAAASGTVSGATSSTYTVNFSGTVPSSGAAVTAYLLASYAMIQENPYTVPGPPPGHPDYNPQFVPYTAYALNVDSLAMTASTTAPDNQTTFEIGRYTLASGASTLTAINTTYQQRASTTRATQTVQASGSLILSVLTHGGKTIQFSASGTATLPAVASANGVSFTVNPTSGAVSLVASGSDLIYGTPGNYSSGISSLSIQQGALVTVQGVLGLWQITAASPNQSVTCSGSTIVGNLAQFSDTHGNVTNGPAQSARTGVVAMASGSGSITPNYVAVFADVSGTVKQGPTQSALTGTVAMASGSGSINTGNFAEFLDANGTVGDSGISPATINATGNTSLYMQGLLL